jgi:hypothetical protein
MSIPQVWRNPKICGNKGAKEWNGWKDLVMNKDAEGSEGIGGGVCFIGGSFWVKMESSEGKRSCSPRPTPIYANFNHYPGWQLNFPDDGKEGSFTSGLSLCGITMGTPVHRCSLNATADFIYITRRSPTLIWFRLNYSPAWTDSAPKGNLCTGLGGSTTPNQEIRALVEFR